MMLGAILALIGGFGVGMFATARDQLVTILFLPLPMLALLAVGLTVHVRLISLALLAVVLAVGTYCRRFGPRGFMGGMLAFMGAFLGFFIQDYVKFGQFGWLVAEIAIGVRRDDRGALRALPAPAGSRRAPDAALLRGACPRPRERGGGTVRGHHPFGRIRREPAGRAAAPAAAAAAERGRPADRRAAQPGGGAGGLERRRPAPAAVRRGGRAEQRGAVRARARPAAASRAGLRADRGRAERHPRRRPARRVRHRRGHQGAARRS